MLRSLSELRRYGIHAVDGNIGGVADFLFDDQEWAIRYLVADTGSWLPGRKVLISPVSISRANWASSRVDVNLTKQQVKDSPDLKSDPPVSRRKEADLVRYYGWPIYWSPQLEALQESKTSTAVLDADRHLRSMKEVTGYYIVAKDGEIGHVETFIADDDDWMIRYFVVDTKNWLPGRKTLVSPQWIEAVNWNDKRVVVDLPRETIEAAPRYDSAMPVNREYELQLYDFYGRPKYWQMRV